MSSKSRKSVGAPDLSNESAEVLDRYLWNATNGQFRYQGYEFKVRRDTNGHPYWESTHTGEGRFYHEICIGHNYEYANGKRFMWRVAVTGTPRGPSYKCLTDSGFCQTVPGAFKAAKASVEMLSRAMSGSNKEGVPKVAPVEAEVKVGDVIQVDPDLAVLGHPAARLAGEIMHVLDVLDEGRVLARTYVLPPVKIELEKAWYKLIGSFPHPEVLPTFVKGEEGDGQE